jgi:uncharacterized protein (TIGR03643 family)
MAWEDRTPFDAILAQFGINEQEVIELLRKELKPGSWRRWRERVNGRTTKHEAIRTETIAPDTREADAKRFKSTSQKAISGNQLAKRRR